MLFGLDPAWGMLTVPFIAFLTGFAWANFGILVAALLKSIDNFNYVTSIVITHDMRSAYTVGTRIAMLYEGKCRWVGTVDDIKQTDDAIVRQFIEGRAVIDEDLVQATP